MQVALVSRLIYIFKINLHLFNNVPPPQMEFLNH